MLVSGEKSAVLPPHFVSASFHSSTTLLGEQTSVVGGISDGDIVKINMGGTHPSDIVARFDAPLLTDVANKELRTRDIKREYFCGHKHPVLFVLSRSAGKLLSVDSDSHIIEWEYDSEHFSGFGWFTPARQYQLDLYTSASEDLSTEDQGTILQIASTGDKKRVVLMVFAAASGTTTSKKKSSHSAGRLYFYQVVADPVQVVPTVIHLDVLNTSSAPPPRFALTTALSAAGKNVRGGSSDHFLFVLMNNSVQILSLSSGESCCTPIQLHQASEPTLVFSTISVSTRCSLNQTAHCSMVVTSDRHSKVLVYRFQQQQQQQ